MNPELRERLGKAAYEAWSMKSLPEARVAWEDQGDMARERFRQQAEAVVHELVGQMMPSVQGILTSLHRYIMGEEVAS